MDPPDVSNGNTLYLPVHHLGETFYVGDAHAAQGLGELCGVALQIPARGTFTCAVIKNKTIEWPRIESSDALMVVGNATEGGRSPECLHTALALAGGGIWI